MKLFLYVDNIIASLIDWYRIRNAEKILEKANTIVVEVAMDCELSFKESKTERLVLKMKSKTKKANYIKWLRMILNNTLSFDLY